MNKTTQTSSFTASVALYKRLFKYLRGYFKIFIVSMISLSLAASTEPLVAMLTKPLVDEGFVQKNPAAMYWVPLAIIGLFLLRGVTGFINEYTGSYLSNHLVQSLRQELFAKLLALPTAFYDDHTSGRVVSRITNDVTQITAAGFNVITVTIKDGVTVIGLLGVLLYIDWQLTTITLLVLPVVTICVRFVSKRLRGLSRKNQQLMGELTQVLSESIDCSKVVKIYGGQKYEETRFKQAAISIRHNNVKQTSTSSMSTGVTQLIIACALAVILYFAMQRASQNNFTAGDFLAFLTAMLALFSPIKRITSITQSLQLGLAAAESVFGFLDETSEPDDGTKLLEDTQGNIQFHQVSFRYPAASTNSIDNISLTIPSGKTVALVGFSGSGKTTLTNLIPRFYLPTDGYISIDGTPINEFQLKSLREKMALVSQEVVLFNDTVAANIAYGKFGATEEEIKAAAIAANALEFINTMPEGFNTLIGENGVRLSGGQRQRLAIARALLKNAPILILDEATSALDTQSERLVQAALDNLMQNRTTLVVAHRLSTIENADMIVVMHQGQIIEQGTHQELLALDGRYASLHKMQFKESKSTLEEPSP
ncbi:lipid A export permease/ATP-binding protein MsbA [Neisseria sp. Ec49-e6-T10]|uniref:lipid A export permease/ATP-binding protein MsbA n=1 Tax=Neisseria sp. Ec49-e6-T10 TaxID=3140744 RepID=UPI003EB97A56